MFCIGDEESASVKAVIDSKVMMRYRGGEGGYTEQFEQKLADTIGVSHALTVNSGTNALIAALVGLGVGPGDEVIVPAYTFMATALAPLAVGAVPIMAEIDETLTIDAKDLEKKITEYTKAIIPVHMLNRPCDMDAIMKIAKKNDLKVLEDACQAVGVTYRGRRLGSIGDAGAFSFNFFKNMTCGEGGAILTDAESIYERALIYHDGGAYDRQYADSIEIPFFPGVNMRVSEIQGAILGEQLKRLDGILEQLRIRREAINDILKASKMFVLAPHHDEDADISVVLTFENAAEAKSFADKHGTYPTIESGRHVYRNWTPIMEQNVQHEKMNPYKWANRKIEYAEDMCPRTLDILSRTVTLLLPYDMSLDKIRVLAATWCE